jgi:hypothetical protein
MFFVWYFATFPIRPHVSSVNWRRFLFLEVYARRLSESVGRPTHTFCYFWEWLWSTRWVHIVSQQLVKRCIDRRLLFGQRRELMDHMFVSFRNISQPRPAFRLPAGTIPSTSGHYRVFVYSEFYRSAMSCCIHCLIKIYRDFYLFFF